MSIYRGTGIVLGLGESELRRRASCPEFTGGSRLVNRKFHFMGSTTGEARMCSGNSAWQLGNDTETRCRWQRRGLVWQARARPRSRPKGGDRVPITFVSLVCNKVPGINSLMRCWVSGGLAGDMNTYDTERELARTRREIQTRRQEGQARHESERAGRAGVAPWGRSL